MNFSSLERLMSKIRIGECAIITSDVNRRYFTGMKSSAGTLLVMRDEVYFIIDFRYIEKARMLLDGSFVNVIMQGKTYEQINNIISSNSVKTMLVEADRCTLLQFAEYEEYLDVEVSAQAELCDIINEIRSVKTNEQCERIIVAQRIAESGFKHMLEFISVGKTEREIALELDYFMLENGADALSFETIALVGKNTSLPHGVPSDKRVEQDDFVLMDFGAVVDGYHSDMTRTICVGQPTDEMRVVYNIVLNAQLAGLGAVRAGISGVELDKVARDIIANAGYGKYFGHSLGHGVGMEIHEAPTASPRSKETLAEGMIVTVEPGIYLPDQFGVRIEDFVIVTKNGCTNMTNAPKNLICI